MLCLQLGSYVHKSFIICSFSLCKRSFLSHRSLESPRTLWKHCKSLQTRSTRKYNSCPRTFSRVSLENAILAKEMEGNLIWVDLEMSGLDVETEHILEMACLVTDSDLNVVAEGPNVVIHQSDQVLDNMNEWCKRHHGESGLTSKVKESKISLSDAENTMLEFIQRYSAKGLSPLAGNSIHMDKKFLEKYMPKFVQHLHYRIVDVSTVKELCRRWYPEIFKMAPTKKETHRAMEDIKESIKELQFYKSTIFRKL